MRGDDARRFSDLIGLEVTDVKAGYSRGTLDVTDRLTNPNGILHGAAAYAMTDSGMAIALQPELAAEERCATIESKISYFEPVSSGTLTCESNLLRRGRTVAFLESDVRQEGTTVARATGSFSIYTP